MLSAVSPLRFGQITQPVHIAPKPQHLINDPAYKLAHGKHQMVVEINPLHRAKIDTSPKTGQQFHEMKNGAPRYINYSGYPGVYGFIPQTLAAAGPGGKGPGDQDPMDVLLLSPAKPQGSVQPMHVLGALLFEDGGEFDPKVIAIENPADFKGIQTLKEAQAQYPGMVDIAQTWFSNYKGPGVMKFVRTMDRDETLKTIEEYHQAWAKKQQ